MHRSCQSISASHLPWSSFWPGCDLRQVRQSLTSHPVQMCSLGASEWEACCLACRSHTALHRGGTEARNVKMCWSDDWRDARDDVSWRVLLINTHRRVSSCKFIYAATRSCGIDRNQLIGVFVCFGALLTFVLRSDWLQPPHWLLAVWKPIKRLVLSMALRVTQQSIGDIKLTSHSSMAF